MRAKSGLLVCVSGRLSVQRVTPRVESRNAADALEDGARGFMALRRRCCGRTPLGGASRRSTEYLDPMDNEHRPDGKDKRGGL